MKIVVVAENMTQFDDYVDDAIKHLIHITHCGSIICVEGLEFIFAKNPYTLYGRSFCPKDKLIYVGSWYRLPLEILDEIEFQFKSRVIENK